MPPLDFPASPTVGQTYPSPPVTGIPTYKWDGAEWLSAFALGKEMVPLDGSQPMTGLLTLSGNPVDPLHAVPKQFLSDPAARPLVYAAPFDAMAYNGMQINGSMEVSQENGTSNVSLAAATLKYIVDGFVGVNLGATRLGYGAQTPIASLPGFSAALGFVCTTPAALAASDAQYIYAPIEGYRWSRLGFGSASAQSVTVGFWVNSPVTGTMAVSVRNAANNRGYVADVPITVANVWQYKTVTVPGCTDGTWPASNAAAANISFCFGAGASFQVAPNTWVTSTNAIATAATTNFWSAANAVYLTGVVVLPGIEAPSAARSPLIMRPYDQELVTCKRYWQKLGGTIQADIYLRGYNVAGDVLVQTLTLPVEMRSAPTGAKVGTWTLYNASQPTIGGTGTRTMSIAAAVTASGAAYAFNSDNTCFITLDARL